MSIRRTIVKANLYQLSVDPSFQRPLDMNRVRKEAANFNPNGLGTLTISKRSDGKLIILDGQHRAALCREVAYKGTLSCVQIEGLSREEEASLFLVLNNSKQVQALDKFRARVVAAENTAVEMQEILTSLGWRVHSARQDFNFAAVTAIEKVYRGAGILTPGEYPALARLTMNTITEAWAGQTNSAHNLIVLSLGKVVAWYPSEIDFAKMVLELSKTKPMNLVTDIKVSAGIDRTDQANAGAKLLVNLHNRNRRTRRLPDWRRTSS